MRHKQNTIFLPETAGNTERARKVYVARAGSQTKHRIWFNLLASVVGHIHLKNNVTWGAYHLAKKSGNFG